MFCGYNHFCMDFAEIMDFGYPQNLSPEILKLYITQEGVRSPFSSKVKAYLCRCACQWSSVFLFLFFFYFIMFSLVSLLSLQPKDKPVPNATLQVTGAVGWRREGLSYKKNEVRIDFLFWLRKSVARFCESADIMHSHWCRCFWILLKA